MHPSIFTTSILNYILESAFILQRNSKYYNILVQLIHEKPVVRFIQQALNNTQSPKVCLDIGANEGSYTQLFYDILGGSSEIHAFEPIPLLADKLKTIHVQHPNVKIHNCALSNNNGQAQFYYYQDTEEHPGVSGASGLTPNAEFNIPPKIITVELKKLDDLRIDRVDFMKVDTEGAELDVLKGGIRTIARSRPFISTEYVHFARHGYSPDDIYKFAGNLEYHILSTFGDDLTNKNVFDAIKPKFWVMCNVFLIPHEKLSSELLNIIHGNRALIIEALQVLRHALSR